MKKKIKQWLACIAVTAGLLSCGTLTAFANPNTEDATPAGSGQAEIVIEEESVDTENPVVDSVLEEQETETGGNSFSIPGNGQLVDDITDDGTKQFLTIRTKNGNTFFLVLDRSSNAENVYALSMIDENDLAEFVKELDTAGTGSQTPQVVLPEKEEGETLSAEPETVAAQEKSEGMNTSAVLAAGVMVACVIGGICYVKAKKAKKADDESDEEDLEFYDDEEYINEDDEEDEE